MRAHCPLVATCRAQLDTGFYCPCRVRALLAEYTDLLDAGSAQKSAHLSGLDRVQGKRPAYEAREEQLCKRADVAEALLWLCHETPAQGYAVAYVYALDVDTKAGTIGYIGRRDPKTGHPMEVPIRTVALLVNNRARSLMTAERQLTVSRTRLPMRDTVRETIERGVEAMAGYLGWKKGAMA